MYDDNDPYVHAMGLILVAAALIAWIWSDDADERGA